jgi:hypothetical protein
MAVRKGHPARSILDPIGADLLRRALERLRENGLSRAEAAAELVRANLYEVLDSERDAESAAWVRLRIVKR